MTCGPKSRSALWLLRSKQSFSGRSRTIATGRQWYCRANSTSGLRASGWTFVASITVSRPSASRFPAMNWSTSNAWFVTVWSFSLSLTIPRQASEERISVGLKWLRAKVLLPDPLGPIRTTRLSLGILICICASTNLVASTGGGQTGVGRARPDRLLQHIFVAIPTSPQCDQLGDQLRLSDQGGGLDHKRTDRLAGEFFVKGCEYPSVPTPGQSDQRLAAGLVIGVGEPIRKGITNRWRIRLTLCPECKGGPIPHLGIGVSRQFDEDAVRLLVLIPPSKQKRPQAAPLGQHGGETVTQAQWPRVLCDVRGRPGSHQEPCGPLHAPASPRGSAGTPLEKIDRGIQVDRGCRLPICVPSDKGSGRVGRPGRRPHECHANAKPRRHPNRCVPRQAHSKPTRSVPQQDEDHFSDLPLLGANRSHSRSNTPICVGAPTTSSTGPTGRNLTP